MLCQKFDYNYIIVYYSIVVIDRKYYFRYCGGMCDLKVNMF